MDETMIKCVDDVAEACRAVKESTKLQALMQVVLEVGNALNAGTRRERLRLQDEDFMKLADLRQRPPARAAAAACRRRRSSTSSST